MTRRAFTSSGKSAPSITSTVTFGLRIAIRLSACTTSGQLWHDRDM